MRSPFSDTPLNQSIVSSSLQLPKRRHPRCHVRDILAWRHRRSPICIVCNRPFRSSYGNLARKSHHGRRRCHPDCIPESYVPSFLRSCQAYINGLHNTVAMFIIGRFILGVGIPFAIVAASSLIGGASFRPLRCLGTDDASFFLSIELSHPKERAILGSLFNSCYFVGSIVAAGVTLGTFAMPNTWGWRIPSILQVVPSAMQIIFVWVLPESPRWLISKGRGDEAFAILAKYHAEGDTESEFVKAEFVQIEKTLQLEAENAKLGWGEVVKSSGMRKRLLIAAMLGLFTQWSGNGLTS